MNGYLRLLMYISLVTAGTAMANDVHVKKVTTIVSSTEISSTVVTDPMAANMIGHGTVAVAPTAAQADQAYADARRSFLAVASGGADVKPGVTVSGTSVSAEDHIAGGKPANVALEDIKVVMDVDNVTLREVMAKIVEQAAAYTGPWTVKWRLRPENLDLLDERVNLTAEANFGEFCDLLAERVKNMTGTQLFVTAFAGTRVLLVTDTYY